MKKARYFFLVAATIFAGLGIYGIATGIISLINREDGSNLLIGIFVLVVFPALMLAAFSIITPREN